MGLPKPDMHIRVSDQCMTALRALAVVKGGEEYPVASLASQLLEETVLGRVHVLMVSADLVTATGLHGSRRERA